MPALPLPCETPLTASRCGGADRDDGPVGVTACRPEGPQAAAKPAIERTTSTRVFSRIEPNHARICFVIALARATHVPPGRAAADRNVRAIGARRRFAVNALRAPRTDVTMLREICRF